MTLWIREASAGKARAWCGGAVAAGMLLNLGLACLGAEGTETAAGAHDVSLVLSPDSMHSLPSPWPEYFGTHYAGSP